jgi:hypothetical protein
LPYGGQRWFCKAGDIPAALILVKTRSCQDKRNRALPLFPGGNMAIYSLHHAAVGRSTHKAGTASAHAKYILRVGADAVAVGAHIPTGKHAAASWLMAEELADRKNARVIDKVMVALPIELSSEERQALVRSFVDEIGQGQIPWIAALHQEGNDQHNPHAHIIIRDRHIETGTRVAKLSEKGSTEFIRWLWEKKANAALVAAGHDTQIDRRSLEERGIKRQAQIHVGPNAQEIARKGLRPASVRVRIGDRVIDYPQIDNGLNRSEFNTQIIRQNNEKSLAKQLEATEARIAGITNEMDMTALLAETGGVIPEALKIKIKVMLEELASFFQLKKTAEKMQNQRRRKLQEIEQQERRQVYVSHLQRQKLFIQAQIKDQEQRRALARQLEAQVYNMRLPTDQRIIMKTSLKDAFSEQAFVRRLEALPTNTLERAINTPVKRRESGYSPSELRQDTLAVKELLKRSQVNHTPWRAKPQQRPAETSKIRMQASDSFKAESGSETKKRKRRRRSRE